MNWLSKKRKTDTGNERSRFFLESPVELRNGMKSEPDEASEASEDALDETAMPVDPVEPPVSAEEDKLKAVEEDQEKEFQNIKSDVHRQVISKIDLSMMGVMQERELRMEIRRVAEELLADRADLLNLNERERLINEVLDETFGLGPLEPLLRDPSITDILINGANTVYVERRGRLERTRVSFANDAHLIKIIQRVVSAVGRRVDETTPMVDARLADGSRVNAIIPPLAIDGPLVSIRRFGAKPLTTKDLLSNHSITAEMVEFLAGCVEARMNVLISGGTGSGKTTLLNVLSSYIPEDERVATIEDAAELQLQQPHVIRMETRAANVEGKGEVPTRELVRNALRMRPDRIVVGECRGPEALDMLQAMNTGHDGSLTTIHANTPRDALMRLEMMVGMAGFDVPIWTIRRQIASAINIVVQSVRLTGGPRKITRVSEITGMEGDVITMHDLFTFEQTGVSEDRVAEGFFSASGVRPHCLDRVNSAGVPMSADLFESRILHAQSEGEAT